MKKLDSLIIALDYDGTVVTHEFPEIGKEIDNCVPTLKRLVQAGAKLILSTMRSNHVKPPNSDDPDIHTEARNYLDEAVAWFKERDIPLWGIQANPEQHTWTSSPKCYAHMYIGDDALGCPLTYNLDIAKRPFADWFRIEDMLFPVETHKVIAATKAAAEKPKGAMPSNLEEAIAYVNPFFDGMEDHFQEKDESIFASFCHSQISGGIGMKIRNMFEFWSNKKTPLYLDLKKNHHCDHPDSMSDIIIRGVYKLRKAS